MKNLLLLVVGFVLASTVEGADWKIGKFTLLSSRVHHATDPVLESRLPPITVPRKEVVIDLGAAYQYRHTQGTVRSVSSTPLPGDRRQVDFSQVVTKSTTVTSRTPDPHYPMVVSDPNGPKAAYVQRTIPLMPRIQRGK